MNWLQKTSQANIRISDPEVTGAHNGQVDCVIKAYEGEQLVGFVTFAVFQGDYHIDYIEVAAEKQRQGIATQMFRKLEESASADGAQVIHTNQTPPGAAWVSSL